MTHPVASATNLPDAFFKRASDDPDCIVYSQADIDPNDPNGGRPWRRVSYQEALDRVCCLTSFLRSVGLKRGDRAAIISATRPEWMEADLAVLALGGVVVSVYQTLPANDVAYILFDSGSKIVFVENQEQAEKVHRLQETDIDIPATEDRPAQTVRLTFDQIISFEEVSDLPNVNALSEILSGGDSGMPTEYQALSRDDVASLVYTSGTTGPPKGVVQTHGNHLANVRQAFDAEICFDDSTLMLFLPLAHSFAKLMGYIGFLTGAEVRFPGVANRRSSKPDPDSITRDIREANAEIVPIVPRLLEKMRAGIQKKSRSVSLGGLVLKGTVWAAERKLNARLEGGEVSSLAGIVYGATDGIRSKIRKTLFGDQFRCGISGGAKLSTEVAYFFEALGVEILEGYGLTETCVATNVNRYGNKKIGTVGPVLSSDIEMRVDQDGEVLFRGPNVAKGYYQRPTATRLAWGEDGWFHTGDLGSIDEDGFLKIEGRKKEIIVTSNGKNIPPERVEQRLQESAYVAQAVVVGDGRPFCVALVTLDQEALAEWAKEEGVSLAGNLNKNDKVRALIDQEFERINSELPRHEHVRGVTIASEEFSVDNGLMTPTFKVKRSAVLKKYEAQLLELYSSDA